VPVQKGESLGCCWCDCKRTRNQKGFPLSCVIYPLYRLANVLDAISLYLFAAFVLTPISLRSEQLHPSLRHPTICSRRREGGMMTCTGGVRVSGEGEDDQQSRGDRFSTNTIQLSFYLEETNSQRYIHMKGRLSSMVHHGPVTARLFHISRLKHARPPTSLSHPNHPVPRDPSIHVQLILCCTLCLEEGCSRSSAISARDRCPWHRGRRSSGVGGCLTSRIGR
jgi:hypothetical protein